MIFRVPPRALRRQVRALLRLGFQSCELAPIYRAFRLLARWYGIEPPTLVEWGEVLPRNHDGLYHYRAEKIQLRAPWEWRGDVDDWLRVALHEFAHHLAEHDHERVADRYAEQMLNL